MSGPPPLPLLREVLLDLAQPVAKRTQAAFYLRTDGSEEAMHIICEGLRQREDGALMRHELAYILGQIQNRLACSTLSQILDDENDDVLVRHECAEALGAIGQISSLSLLEKYRNHPMREIAETCDVAIDLINWNHSGDRENIDKSLYLSHDPAPPLAVNGKGSSISELESMLLDSTKSLFMRYRAMFSLRDMNNDEAALVLVKGFSDESALFRHEIAFVLGQMQRKSSAAGRTTSKLIHATY
jgi:deoxyhypusine monooxygenase